MRHISVLAVLVVALSGCSANRQAAGTGNSTVSQPPPIRVSGPPNTLPVGTQLDVRTDEAIVSTNPEGRTYAAEIATDVVDSGGRTLVPRGSAVELVVLENRPRSGVRGAGLQLGMRSVTVNGTSYLIVSKELEQGTGVGRNRRTAEMVGGGAALGTVIGAAAGGTKGAVLGGLAGAAAGAVAQILTQGKEVNIPAETVLQFRLDEPLMLQPMDK